jgi:hypothetical protein
MKQMRRTSRVFKGLRMLFESGFRVGPAVAFSSRKKNTGRNACATRGEELRIYCDTPVCAGQATSIGSKALSRLTELCLQRTTGAVNR